MKTEYKKDLRHSYMIISDEAASDAEAYCMKMLEHQKIEGILPVEQRRFNENVLYYYDISSRQSMAALLDRAAFSAEKIRCLCTGIIDTLERAYEYLLPGEDFILTPEYIFLGVETDEAALCFLPGYGKGVSEQMSGLLEQLMNKVDYNDKEAVLLVYRMYAVSREEGYTLWHLKNELEDPAKTVTDSKEVYQKKSPLDDEKEVKLAGAPVCQKSTFPIMAEKLEQEVETNCYPLKTYLYTAASVLGGILLIVFCLTSKLLYNTYGNRLDYMKVSALLLIIICLEGYLMKMIWDKRNRITRMVTENKYVDPRDYINTQVGKEPEKIKIINSEKINRNIDEKGLVKASLQENVSRENVVKDNVIRGNSIENNMIKENITKDDNPTCLLNSDCRVLDDKVTLPKAECILEALNNKEYKSIPITEFPFFIGKLHKKVDYCLNQETVSRYHAKLLKEKDCYYIMDMNSTNGTFVNEKALQVYVKREILHGDEIAFADIKYRVEIKGNRV